jgi:hypothetical protein
MTKFEEFIVIAYQISQESIVPYASKFSNKIYRQTQLLTLILLKQYKGWDYRETEEMVASNPRIRELLALKSTPDHSTLQKFNKRLSESIIQKVFNAVLKRFKKFLAGRRRALIDSTGYRLTQASLHYLGSRWYKENQGENKPRRPFVKHTILVDEFTQLLFGQRVRWGPSGDFTDFKPTIKTKPPWISISAIAADSGFDSKSNHHYVRSGLKAKDAIKIGSGRPGKLADWRQKIKRYFPHAFYRLRVKVEGCISVIKRKFKNHILTRNNRLRLLEALLMGVVYNIHRGLQLGVLVLLSLLRRISTQPPEST